MFPTPTNPTRCCPGGPTQGLRSYSRSIQSPEYQLPKMVLITFSRNLIFTPSARPKWLGTALCSFATATIQSCTRTQCRAEVSKREHPSSLSLSSELQSNTGGYELRSFSGITRHLPCSRRETLVCHMRPHDCLVLCLGWGSAFVRSFHVGFVRSRI